MGVCFICDVKLYGERTRVCSSITPHSNTPFPEKIAEIMGEDFLVVVTPVDHLCKKCSSLLTHMDKLEHDLKAVRNAVLSFIQKKYGVLPADQPVKTLDVVNGNLRTEDVETSQRKVPSGLTVRDTPTVNSPLKITKTVQPDMSSKIKIYKCGFCAFQSKELGHVRFHMRSHMNKKGDGEKTAQTGTKLLTPVSSQQQQQQQQQKKRLYRCQVCSSSFDSRQICLNHIQKNHNQQTAKEDIPLETSKEIAEENQEAGVSTMDMGYDEQDKGAVNTDVLLNDDVPAEESQQETQNIEEHVSTQIGTMKVEQETNIQKEAEEDMEIANEDNKTGDLDIESMLAAIHQDTPPADVGVVDNIV